MAKKKKNKFKLTPKKAALLAALISLVSFLYKLSLGIISSSIVLIVASLSTLIVFVSKFIYYKRMDGERIVKKRAYFAMAILAASFGVLFLLFTVLKVAGIDTSNQREFNDIVGYILIGFMLIMFVLSVLGLKGALEKTDLMIIGLKEVIFVSTLADAVIIEGFLYYAIPYIRKLPLMGFINSYFPLIIAIVMLIIPVLMLRRLKNYKV